MFWLSDWIELNLENINLKTENEIFIYPFWIA